MELRNGCEPDRVEMAAIYAAARETAGCYCMTSVEFAEFLELFRDEEVHIAEHEGTICGFASLYPPATFLHHLYVRPNSQRIGIGRALLSRCLERYGRDLSLKCNLRNLQAGRFYRRSGFRAVEIGRGEDGVWQLMKRDPRFRTEPQQ